MLFLRKIGTILKEVTISIGATTGFFLLPVLPGVETCFFWKEKKAFADVEADPILLILSSRHMNTSLEKLEKTAGGKENLVHKLLALRQDESVGPFVPLRAEKFLLSYADREEVENALMEDLLSPRLTGLARIIVRNLDQAPTSELRQRFARAALERAKSDTEFVSVAKALQESKDGEVKRMAREELR